ncbi:hypothetical protein [Bradyrhizobium elkanii]|uniref:hypothetical protein n=1 Tax=Bradyrhizobium elkanii TaxID=29448 RepID=UPI00047FBD90|nr:hypothetical protein [Bradyrhizobium elkanii]
MAEPLSGSYCLPTIKVFITKIFLNLLPAADIGDLSMAIDAASRIRAIRPPRNPLCAAVRRKLIEKEGQCIKLHEI